ncbi:hypothetical protein [Planktotalea sp.]|uniref:hypothetical protein n=1 Tax=Planktotalea sp. TaxID=2029877 RepID=UPI0032981C69
MHLTSPIKLCALLASLVAPNTALAQDIDLTGKISVELNAADPVADSAPQACTLSFFITNGMEHTLDSLVVETVLFDAAGKVDRLTLFDFGALPTARPRVRQFAVPNLACDNIGRILINGVQNCAGGTADNASCGDALLPSSRTNIEVIG